MPLPLVTRPRMICPAPAVNPPAKSFAPAPAPVHKTVIAAAPVPPPPAPVTPAAAVTTSADLPDLWQKLIDAVGRVSPFTRGYLIDAHPVSFDKGLLVIGYDPEFEDHLGLVDNARNHTLIATKLSELGHPNAKVKFIKAEAPAGWERRVVAAAPAPVAVATRTTTAAKPVEAGPAPAAEKKTAPIAFNKDEFKNDPLIQKALEIFKGTIVEVRA